MLGRGANHLSSLCNANCHQRFCVHHYNESRNFFITNVNRVLFVLCSDVGTVGGSDGHVFGRLGRNRTDRQR